MKRAKLGYTAILVVGCGLLPGALVQGALNPDDGDIRNLKVDTPLSSMSEDGYVNFACGNNGAEPGIKLQSWNNYKNCSPDDDGLHEVSVRYDDSKQQWAGVNDKWEGTKIAGHPVILSMLIDSTGVVRGLRAVTDPGSRSYLKKKAYLLSYKVKSRYGSDNWACLRNQPQDGEMALGGLFIKESCAKEYHGRSIQLKTQLYRAAGQEGEDFNNSTWLEIRSNS